MKKIIAIPGFMNDNKTTFGCGSNHLEFVSEFGTPRILMPGEDFYKVDALYLPGGMDLNPASYGEVPRFKTSHTDVYKQYFFDHKLKEYVENGIPIFGVCLGMQQLGAFFGCKLTQNLKWHAQSKDRWSTAHRVLPMGIGKGFVTLKPEKDNKVDKGIFEVNSHHHQAILKSGFNYDDLKILAITTNEENNGDPIVEAFKHKDLPIFGVQWHPEELYDEFSRNIMTSILQ